MRSLRLLIVVFLIALPVSYGLNVVASLKPTYDEYFALYTLGAAGLAERYFPSSTADILPGTQLSWQVAVYNHMEVVRLVKVEFKLLNLTMQGPDQVKEIPSQREPFYEETRLILSNETWTVPVAWSVRNATKGGNSTTIHSLEFNDQIITENVEISAFHGHSFRIVIELWVYDDGTGTFAFQWAANGDERVAWNQLWFNMTQTSLLPT